ncbi:unnamed protein product [Owenia fusiformis]|uniref:Uncharacterized protein n=1 Tax=Owenia fusiformis TaxID=6347 RepID=A0A8S4ND24_OWEFU|nr:unnamed protein product [Owenia fusiformis]
MGENFMNMLNPDDRCSNIPVIIPIITNHYEDITPPENLDFENNFNFEDMLLDAEEVVQQDEEGQDLLQRAIHEADLPMEWEDFFGVCNTAFIFFHSWCGG